MPIAEYLIISNIKIVLLFEEKSENSSILIK
jgi:hypothetical protein